MTKRENTRPAWRRWIGRNKQWLVALVVLLVLVDALLVAYVWLPSLSAGELGGLEGCLATASGEPLLGTVSIADVVRSTSTDGCFFFSALPAGSQRMSIVTNSGASLEQRVRIVSGQAANLGTVIVR